MDMTNLPAGPVTAQDVTSEDAELLEALPAPSAPLDVEELEDGSAIVNLQADEAEEREEAEFSANLADGYLSSSDLTELGSSLSELIDSDKESRTERDKQQALGIQRTGLGGEAPGGAEFEGSSRAVHPMLAKGCVDFASKAIKELYPAAGPCKTQVIGEATDAKLDKAERKKTYINWQLTTQVQENRAEFESLLSQLPLGGSQYKRWWWDAGQKRLRTETVYVDDVFLPYNQNDFYSSYRVTHRQYISQVELDRRTAAGLYCEVNGVGTPVGMQDQSSSKQATDKIEGSEEDTAAYNKEGLREVYMCYVDLELDADTQADEGRTAPYIVHVEAYSNKVLGVYRNWAEDDPTFAKKPWMVEYTFVPWRGGRGIGLTHLIGSLSAAATGALRALLDAAHINNFPGGLKLRGGRTAGQSITVNATELAEIDAPPGVDDIRKLVMAFPFNGPSAVLQNLLEWLTQQAETVVATAGEKIADGGANMPMGTALALIEQGSTNFSAIHSRLHAALRKELEIVHRLNAEHLSDKEVVAELGELVVSRADFQGPLDVIPVSDPNIFSEAQRYAQLQAVMQLKADPAFAQFFDPAKLLRRALKLLQIPSVEDIANLPKEPSRLDALEENYICAAPEPSPLKVYADQEDLAHLEAHVHFMTSPMFGANPIIAPQALPPLIQHCKEHLMAFYRKHSKAAAGALLQVAQTQSIEVTEHDAQAKGAAFADQLMANLLGSTVMPGLASAVAMVKQLTPPPPASPDATLSNTTQMEVVKLQEKGKLDAKDKDLMYQKQRDDADRAANDRAAEMATAMERFQSTTSERMSQFTTQAEMMRDNLAHAAAAQQLELKATQDQMLTLLNGAITQYGVPEQTSSLVQQMALQSANQSDAIANLTQNITQANQDMQAMRALVDQVLKVVTTPPPAPPPGLMQRMLGGVPTPQVQPVAQASQPGVPNEQQQQPGVPAQTNGNGPNGSV